MAYYRKFDHSLPNNTDVFTTNITPTDGTKELVFGIIVNEPFVLCAKIKVGSTTVNMEMFNASNLEPGVLYCLRFPSELGDEWNFFQMSGVTKKIRSIVVQED